MLNFYAKDIIKQVKRHLENGSRPVQTVHRPDQGSEARKQRPGPTHREEAELKRGFFRADRQVATSKGETFPSLLSLSGNTNARAQATHFPAKAATGGSEGQGTGAPGLLLVRVEKAVQSADSSRS